MAQEYTLQPKAYAIQTTKVFIITQTETDDLGTHQSSKGVHKFKRRWDTPTYEGVYRQ